MNAGRRSANPAGLLLVAAAVAGWFLAGPARGQGAGESGAVLPVLINDVSKGDFVVIVRGADVLVRVDELRTAGVHGFAGAREVVRGRDYVSLTSLAPAGFRFKIDPQTVTLVVTVPPGFLPSTPLDLAAGPPAGIEYAASTSAFLNYSLATTDFKGVAAFGEAGLSTGAGLLYTSFSRDASGAVSRGLSYFEADDRARLRRLVVGDAYASSGILGGAVQLAGVTLARGFDLDPYLVRYPTLTMTGAVTTPSTADVYVNGALVKQQQIAPGTFDFSNLALPTGSGVAEVVIRDAFGQEHVVTNPFYASTAVLARGLQDYSYSVGYLRNTAAGDDAYRSLSFIGVHRIGISDYVTPGFRLEADSTMVSGGPAIALRSRFGEMVGSLAWSRADGVRGAAGALGYQYVTRFASFGLNAVLMSDRYANLSLSSGADRAKSQVEAFVGAEVAPPMSLSLDLRRSRMRDTSDTDQLSLSATVLAFRGASVLVSLTRSRDATGYHNGGFVGLTFAPGQRTTAAVSSRAVDGSTTTTASVEQSLPVGEGFGYRLQGVQAGGQTTGDGLFSYQGPFGLYELEEAGGGASSSTSVRASGSIVAIGGRVFAARAIGESYALIRVPDVEGVRGLANNQVVGRTDAGGDLLLPSLLPYYGNRLGIADADVPLDYQIGATERTVATPVRGGAVVTFPVQRYQGFRGRVVVAVKGREVAPANGELTVDSNGTRIASPIGVNGEFELANVRPGRYPSTVEFTDGSCRFFMVVPKSAAAIVDLGVLKCGDVKGNGDE